MMLCDFMPSDRMHSVMVVMHSVFCSNVIFSVIGYSVVRPSVVMPSAAAPREGPIYVQFMV